MRSSESDFYMDLAIAASKRSTCIRRKVGCVLISATGLVLAIGYNGVPAGMNHCNEGFPCLGADRPSGTGLEECLAIHAEQNALLQCADVSKIWTVAVTASPCIHCMKMLLNTGANQIVFGEIYDKEALQLWRVQGRNWTYWKEE